MTDDRRTQPPSIEHEVGVEHLADGAVRLLLKDPDALLDRVMRTLARVDEENDGNVEAVRQHTKAIEALKESHDRVAAALMVVGGQVAKLDERTATLCELHQAGYRQVSDDVQALQWTFEHVAKQVTERASALEARVTVTETETSAAAVRLREHGGRLGAVEADLGEAPNDIANRPGSGIRGAVATLLRDLRQRKGIAAVSALAGGTGGYALIKLLDWLLSN